ncbi:MAG TPA: ABC transporter ATP-binding protein [Anaerovoracaceae bacterium]|nr:ABC transporter ATP-binding protein [Anaerovoracaceae bacterium]
MTAVEQDNKILAISNLSVNYGDFQAIEGVSLTIPENSIVSIIGSNGAGKSTLMNAIMGINKPKQGTITYRDQSIVGLSTNKIVSKGITMSPEGSHVFENMTVLDNLLMGSFLPQARANKGQQLEKVFSLFPVLKEKSNQYSTYLSGGQRQMLALGRAIMAGPKLLLCDEISLGLAPVVIKDIYVKLKEINREGITIVLVEQDVTRSLKNSDYSYVMLKGKIVMQGKSSELDQEEVTDAYFGMNKYA